MDDITPGYDGSIQGLLGECETDWGDPIVNRANLVPYGIAGIDEALWGIDIVNGELDMILGPHKQRKTTLAINIICNVMTLKQPAVKPVTVVDALESGMNPKRYRDTIIANMATRYLMAKGHVPGQVCPACGGGNKMCQQLGLSPEFLRYKNRTAEQQVAIQWAMSEMSFWPLRIYGANPTQGNTRNLQLSVTDKESRWLKLIKRTGAKLFIIDHVQQYSIDNRDATDYEKQLRAVGAVGDMVAMHFLAVLMLSQVSLSSWREAAGGTGKLNAAGGNKGASEANVVFSAGYENNSGRMKIAIEDSRKSDTFTVFQPLEDMSGAFYGKAFRHEEFKKE